ncbi:hypothetical protein D3260_00890 [Salinisphaera sp. Q1T1-3]|nr:hypothetical protein D3260_00890 [Salinisphaera sp. Q1T1-3]
MVPADHDRARRISAAFVIVARISSEIVSTRIVFGAYRANTSSIRPAERRTAGDLERRRPVLGEQIVVGFMDPCSDKFIESGGESATPDTEGDVFDDISYVIT